jgi:SAM-dependent methyltransferase
VTDSDVQSAYSARADEYVSVLGSIEAMHELDRQLIFRWASQLSGRIVDVGCGPGHWTDFLSKLGGDVEGVDLVPAFVDQAQARFPNVPFRVASFDSLDLPAGRVADILAWYSVIHLDPGRVPVVLEKFARSLEPGGSLLLGLFEGARLEQFPHVVTAAYFWPVEEMTRLLENAGLVVEEIHTRVDPNRRPHAAIMARLVAADPASAPAR